MNRGIPWSVILPSRERSSSLFGSRPKKVGRGSFIDSSSIGFIYYSNYKVGLLVTLALIVIIFAVLMFYKKIRQGINVRNNHYENKVTAVQNGYKASVSFFNRRRKLEIFESTLQGKNWFLVGMIKSIFLVLSIIILITTSNDITTGSVITIYSYVNNFLISLMSIPIAGNII